METKKKKILYIITKSNFGGAQRYVYELATQLHTDQYEVVVAFGGGGLLKDKLEAAGIRTHVIQSFERDISVGKEMQSIKELYGLISQEQPDIVHLNSSKAGGSGALVARFCGVKKIVFTAHGWPFFENRNILWTTIVWIFSWITALLAHKVIVVSDHDKDHSFLPLVQKKCTVIHTGVPTIAFEPRQAAREELFSEPDIRLHEKDVWFITNAELTPNKNVRFAIDEIMEWNRSHEHKIFYSIMGDGELRESLEAHISENGGTEQIRILGYVPDSRKYLKAFDAFLLPSKKEGLPYALLEAGAAGLPTIASCVGGIPEVISHEEAGILIDPENKESLRKALTILMEDPTLQRKYEAALKDRVENDFTLSKMLAETQALYEANGSRAS